MFDVAAGSTVTPYDHGLVGVIDGRILKLTPLRLVNVAPPMCQSEVVVDEAIVDVAFNSTGSQFAVLTQSAVHVFDWDLSTKPVSTPTPSYTAELSPREEARARQIVFCGEKILALRQILDQGSLIEQYIASDQVFSPAHRTIEPAYIATLATDVTSETVWFCEKGSAGSKICHFKPNDDSSPHYELQIADSVTSSTETPWFKAVSCENGEVSCILSSNDKETNIFKHVLISLTKTGALYANKRLIAKNCTSFVVTPAHLIYTTSLHLLKFIHITNVDSMLQPFLVSHDLT